METVMNHNVISLPNLGDNLTEADIVAFHAAGLALPQFQHGPRDCTADWYAVEDRRSFEKMRLREEIKKAGLNLKAHALTMLGL
jgi:hypothetical protein